MKLRTLLAGALGGVGAVAVANRLLVTDELAPPLGREPRTYQWRGFDVSYTEVGDPADPDLLLLHGLDASASSHEFAPVVDQLATRYHVLAPDLPGFGLTDRPPLTYAGPLYEAFVADFARDLTEDAVCVGTKLAGVSAAQVASEASFAELILVSPPVAAPPQRPWLRSLLRTPLVGPALFNVLVSRPGIRYALSAHDVADPSAISGADVAYRWRTAHRPGARFAPASALAGDLHADMDPAGTLAGLEAPITIVCGRASTRPSVERARALAERVGARLLVVEAAAASPHVEYPEEFVSVVRDRLAAEA